MNLDLYHHAKLEDVLTAAFLQVADPNLLGGSLRAQSLKANTCSSHVFAHDTAHLLPCRKGTKACNNLHSFLDLK